MVPTLRLEAHVNKAATKRASGSERKQEASGVDRYNVLHAHQQEDGGTV